MNFPKTTKIIPSSFYPNYNNKSETTFQKQDKVHFNRSYEGLHSNTGLKKKLVEDNKVVSYIDNTISLFSTNDSAALNDKLNKFFRPLARNYIPKAANVIEKSSQESSISIFQENSFKHCDDVAPYQSSLQNPLILNRIYAKMHKSKSQAEISDEYKQLSKKRLHEGILNKSYDDCEERNKTKGRKQNSIYKTSPQKMDNAVNKHQSQLYNCSPNNKRSKSNPSKYVHLDDKAKTNKLSPLGTRNPNLIGSNSSQLQQSFVPSFNLYSSEENCNYSYLKSCDNEIKEIPAYTGTKFKVHKDLAAVSPNRSLYNKNTQDILSVLAELSPIKRNTENFIGKENIREMSEPSKSSNLRNSSEVMSTTQSSQKNSHIKKEKNFVDTSTIKTTSNVFRNTTYSEQEEVIQTQMFSKSIGGTMSSSLLIEMKDENPNYTNIKQIDYANKQQYESRNEHPLPFSKRSNLASSLPLSTEDIKLKTLSQLTDMLDSEVVNKQRGCFNLFITLHNLCQQKLNLGFQALKMAQMLKKPLYLQGDYSNSLSQSSQDHTSLKELLTPKYTNSRLKMIVEGFIKINRMTEIIHLLGQRNKRNVLEKLKINNFVCKVNNKNRITSGCNLVSKLFSSIQKSLLSQSFNSCKLHTISSRSQTKEQNAIVQLVKTFALERQKLLKELLSVKTALENSERISQQYKEIVKFAKGMETPQESCRVREETEQNSQRNINTLTIDNKNIRSFSSNLWEPLGTKTENTNQPEEVKQNMKIFNKNIKNLVEQKIWSQRATKANSLFSSGKDIAHVNPGIRSADADQSLYATASRSLHDHTETLKYQSNQTLEEKILCFEDSWQTIQEEKSGKNKNPKEFTTRIQYPIDNLAQSTELIYSLDISQSDLPKRKYRKESITSELRDSDSIKLIESMRWLGVNNLEKEKNSETYWESRSILSVDQSEIMKEGIENTKDIKTITKNLVERDFSDISLIASEEGVNFIE